MLGPGCHQNISTCARSLPSFQGLAALLAAGAGFLFAARRGGAGPGGAWLGRAWQGMARLGRARLGRARLGKATHTFWR